MPSPFDHLLPRYDAVVIAGDLRVHPWSLRPRVEADDVRIAQPVWVRGGGDMAGDGGPEARRRGVRALRR